MRASVLVLGPLLARAGSVRVSLPGGCAIGVRPINLHLAAFEKLGAEVRLEHGYVEAKASRLTGADIAFDTVTVTGTENVMLAAALARGTTRLVNAAREPEVVDLAGAADGDGREDLRRGDATRSSIEGVERLHGAEHSVIPDRIEAGTYALAAAATRGDVRIARCAPGAPRRADDAARRDRGPRRRGRRLAARARRRRPPVARRRDRPYPGFPTDLQAQWMAFATGLDGVATITETIFENRFQHVAELVRMGAKIRLEGRWAVVEGPSRLAGARVMASDLRASAALVIAGLAAEGETTIERVYHLDRGYQRMEEKLGAVGARREKGEVMRLSVLPDRGRRDPLEARLRGRPRVRVPRHRAEGADARPRRPAQAHRPAGRRRPRRTRSSSARSSPGPPRSRATSDSSTIASSPTTARAPARRCFICTST